MITINLEKAKVATKERLRAEREPLLAALDVTYQRNIETGADNTVVVAEKQRLRDITARVDECQLLDALSNIKVA